MRLNRHQHRHRKRSPICFYSPSWLVWSLFALITSNNPVTSSCFLIVHYCLVAGYSAHTIMRIIDLQVANGGRTARKWEKEKNQFKYLNKWLLKQRQKTRRRKIAHRDARCLRRDFRSQSQFVKLQRTRVSMIIWTENKRRSWSIEGNLITNW